MEIKSWLKILGVGLVKNGFDHSGLRTLKLVVSQKRIKGINWFLVCYKNSGKPKVTLIIFGNFWMVVIKNGCGLLGLGALKSVVSQE